MQVAWIVGLVALVGANASSLGGPRKFFQGAPPVDTQVENETTTVLPSELINPHNNRTEEELKTVRDYLSQLKQRFAREAQPSPVDEATTQHPRVALDSDAKQAPEVVRINSALSDYLYQGDIAVTADQAKHLLAQASGREKRQAIKDANYRWPTNAPIPYVFDSSITADVKSLIQKAIKIWQSNTCLTFQENGSGANKLRFYKGSGCWSYIGKIYYWQQQDVSIGDGCEHVGIIAHEIGHALGFFHAQSRYDRDTYVTYNAANVNSGSEDQFNKETTETNDNYGVTYDYGSVMHYSDASFAKNAANPVLVAKETWSQKTMGQRIQPSFLDLLVMNKHYQCTNKCSTSGTQCKNGGFPNPSACNRCICPWGFGGALCDQRPAASNGSATCGSVLQAGADWKDFNVIIGDGTTVMKPDFESCHWHVQAPAGKKIQFQWVYVGRVCSDGCFYGNTELKLGNFERTGYRFCCAAQVTNQPVLTSQGNFAIVSMYSKYFLQQAHLKYKYG